MKTYLIDEETLELSKAAISNCEPYAADCNLRAAALTVLDNLRELPLDEARRVYEQWKEVVEIVSQLPGEEMLRDLWRVVKGIVIAEGGGDVR